MSKSVTLKTLSDFSEMTGRFCSAGFEQLEAESKAKLFADSAKVLCDSGFDDATEATAFFVPGRIEVLGKHTDYNGGRSILAAVAKGFCFIAVRREDSVVRIFNVAGNEQVDLEIGEEIEARLGHWSNYPATVIRRLAQNFTGSLCGADIAFASDLPPASGMSSSSAMVVGFFLVLSDINDLEDSGEYKNNIGSREDLGEYLGTVENGQTYGTLVGNKGVGTFGGSEDHTAILCCKAGKLSQYSYSPVRFEREVELLSDYVFVVASSGVVAEKTGAALDKYNRASLLCRCAVEVWNKATGRGDRHLAAVIASSADAPDTMRKVLKAANGAKFSSEDLLRRFEHFFAESEYIIPAASDALAAGDVTEFGKQVDVSQEYTDTLLQNQVPETIFLAKSARELGAVAASAFGAGFGGSVWALIEAGKSEKFVRDWETLYKGKFPESAADALYIVTRPGSAAFKL